jgi:hypothetical protein
MIKRCNDFNLVKLKVDEKYFLFYQIWKELTEKKTLDTYQYRIMNTLLALQELNDIIDLRMKGYHTTNHNIEECQAETMSVIKKDNIIQKYYPVIGRRLMNHLGLTTDSVSKQLTLHYQIEYCYDILKEDYFRHLLEQLKIDIDSQDKKNIMAGVNCVISMCVSSGWTLSVLSELIYVFNNSTEDSICWNNFTEQLLKHGVNSYKIFIPFQIRGHLLSFQGKDTHAEQTLYAEIEDLGMVLKDSSELCDTYKYINFKKNKRYFVFDIDSYDYYMASHEATAKYADNLNLLSFYGIVDAWSLRDIRWLVANTALQTCKELNARDLYSVYDYMEGAYNLYKSSKIINRWEGTALQMRLQSVYSYANMGKASYAQTERFMNTWVALESLCRTGLYDNIISNVLETVPAALCLRYIYKLYRNFMEDCLRCKVDFCFSTETIDTEKSKEAAVEKLLSVFNNSVLYVELEEKCNINCLLLERCHEMRNIAIDNTKMFDKIVRHYTNVRRQLARLYRIRNEIAHSAKQDEVSLIKYVEHLDNYLATFVAEIVRCAAIKGDGTIEIETVFEIIKNNYRDFEAIQKSKGKIKADCLHRLLKTGVINLI